MFLPKIWKPVFCGILPAYAWMNDVKYDKMRVDESPLKNFKTLESE